jgi:hypothetical protein
MQKNFYLIIILFCLVSCYTYQVKKPAEATVDNKQDAKKSAALAILILRKQKAQHLRVHNRHLFQLIFSRNLLPIKMLKLMLTARRIK